MEPLTAAAPNLLDPAILTILIAGTVTIVGAIATAAVKIIRAVGDARRELVAGQLQSRVRSVKRDRQIGQIHGLVNSRLLTVLRLLVISLQREMSRTNDPADIAAWQAAARELEQAEQAAALDQHAIQAQDEEDTATLALSPPDAEGV